MTFEKQFPSLVGKAISTDYIGVVYDIETIKENCIDKQKFIRVLEDDALLILCRLNAEQTRAVYHYFREELL